jgi:hypothetical protein
MCPCGTDRFGKNRHLRSRMGNLWAHRKVPFGVRGLRMEVDRKERLGVRGRAVYVDRFEQLPIFHTPFLQLSLSSAHRHPRRWSAQKHWQSQWHPSGGIFRLSKNHSRAPRRAVSPRPPASLGETRLREVGSRSRGRVSETRCESRRDSPTCCSTPQGLRIPPNMITDEWPNSEAKSAGAPGVRCHCWLAQQ